MLLRSVYLLVLLLVAFFLLLQELRRVSQHAFCQRRWTYLDEGFGALQEMLLALGLGALLVPVYDGLVRNTVLIIQNLENLRKRLDDARVFITIHLYDIDEGDFGLCAVTEWLEDGGIFL